ncbi:MAG: TIGR03618 family F420-dependent PPOX class oxidoreductase [Dehalococcoidia bacterium]
MSSELTIEALDILSGRHVGVLSTLSRGAPTLACVWYGVHEGDIVISTPTGRRKDRNVQADARVAFLVDERGLDHTTTGLGYRGVEIRGIAAIAPDPASTVRRLIVARYLDPITPESEARMIDADRAVIRITPQRVRTWDYRQGR